MFFYVFSSFQMNIQAIILCVLRKCIIHFGSEKPLSQTLDDSFVCSFTRAHIQLAAGLDDGCWKSTSMLNDYFCILHAEHDVEGVWPTGHWCDLALVLNGAPCYEPISTMIWPNEAIQSFFFHSASFRIYLPTTIYINVWYRAAGANRFECRFN